MAPLRLIALNLDASAKEHLRLILGALSEQRVGQKIQCFRSLVAVFTVEPFALFQRRSQDLFGLVVAALGVVDFSYRALHIDQHFGLVRQFSFRALRRLLDDLRNLDIRILPCMRRSRATAAKREPYLREMSD